MLAGVALYTGRIRDSNRALDRCFGPIGTRRDTMRFEIVRDFALALPEVTEEPHFTLTSFRIRGKIFSTASLDQSSVNIFIEKMDRERALALDPVSFEKLWWGASVMGRKAHLAQADPNLTSELLRLSWLRKAPKRLKKDHGDFR